MQKLGYRNEGEIFKDLELLCASQGYAHAIAYFCQRDNLVRYKSEMNVDDTNNLYSPKRLIRSEITTLIGLMVRRPVDFSTPDPATMAKYIDQTEALLEELHKAIGAALWSGLADGKVPTSSREMLSTGGALREPIFYGGESAYSFQYRDFASPKYAADENWLRRAMGFSVGEAALVAKAVGRLQPKKQLMGPAAQKPTLPQEAQYLDGFCFTAAEVGAASGVPSATVEAVLEAFALPPDNRNDSFTALNEFNQASATPLIRRGDGYLLFQYYSLVEALYEAPFYWMLADKSYRATALTHRGQFTESQAREMLERVFDRTNVHAGIKIVRGKGETVSDIDVLVVYGDRAIVVQAKSKRLTAEARKGNDFQIKDDFKKAVQDAADQALTCAEALVAGDCKFVRADGVELVLPRVPSRIYPVCVVADHYPALSFQARQFLQFRSSEAIAPIIATDIFALDAMTEMLRSPLRLLHYLDLRAKFGGKLHAMHELTLLGYHLSLNLWVDEEHDFVMLDDDIGAHLDLAMIVRRDGVPGPRTPPGILTKLVGTPVGRLIDEIERSSDQSVISLGFLLLTLSENTIDQLNDGMRWIASRAQNDTRVHDLSMVFRDSTDGLTVYCARGHQPRISERLHAHCLQKKYTLKADSWFGVIVRPEDFAPVFGLQIAGAWEPDSDLDELVKAFPSKYPIPNLSALARGTAKIGRNAPCPCGSGKKYKNCCIGGMNQRTYPSLSRGSRS